jgi:hypothetical protein
MASEREANRARAEHSDLLRRLGAHSIGVDEWRQSGETGFAVIAFFEDKPEVNLPQTLEIKAGNRTVSVPLVFEIMKTPSPE